MKAVYRGDHKLGEIEILKENVVYENGFVTVYDDDVVFPGGNKGKYFRTGWKGGYGVMVIAITDNDEMVLIDNFRHQERRWQLDIPKGFGVEGMLPIDCANKELEEETGLFSNDLVKIKLFEESIDVYLYVAKSLEVTKSCLEDSEAIRGVKLVSKAEAVDLLFSDKVNDPVTLFALSLFVGNKI